MNNSIRLQKKFGVLVLLLGMLAVLSGCSEINKVLLPAETTQPVEDTPAGTVSPSLTETPVKVTQTSTNSNELVLWVPPQFDPKANTPSAKLFQQQLDSFSEENPDVLITVRVKAASGAGGLLDSLSNASVAAPSALPSLIALSRSDMEIAALKGLIFPWNGITNVMKETDWYPYAAQLGSLQGNDYGLPFAGDALMLVYRPLQVSYAPDKWVDYVARGFPIAIPAADPRALVTAQMLLSNRTSDNPGPNDKPVTEDELKKVYLLINDAVKNGVLPYWMGEFETFDQTWKSFNDQQSNYAVVWASSVIESMPANTEMADLPVMGNEPYTLSDGWMWCITDPSPERHKLAAALAEHLIDADFLAAWTEASHTLPTRSSSLSLWQDQSQTKFLDALALSAHIIPSNEFISTISPLLEQSTVGMVRGQISFQQALDLTLKGVK